jgi:hypothetical protein
MSDSPYWFTAKKRGMGWYPCSHEGWIVLISFIVATSIPVVFLVQGASVVAYLIYVAVLSTALIVILHKKGER